MRRLSSKFMFIFIFMIIFIGIGGPIIASFILKDKSDTMSVECDVTLTEQGDMIVKEQLTCSYPNGKSVQYKDFGTDKYLRSDFGFYANSQSYLNEESVSVKVFCDDRLMIDTATTTSKDNAEVNVGYSFKNDIEQDPEGTGTVKSGRSGLKRIYIWVKDGFKGVMKYEFNYTVIGAVSKYADYSMLNWCFYDKIDAAIRDVKYTLNVPNNDAPIEQFMINGYGSDGVSAKFNSNNVAEISTPVIKKNEIFEFRALMPNSLFSKIPPNRVAENTILSDVKADNARIEKLSETRNTKRNIGYIVTGTVVLLVISCAFFAWLLYGKKFKVNNKMQEVRRAPNDLPPAFVSQLSLKELGNKDISATLMDLARRGYIRITNEDDFKIRLLDNNFSELRSYEMSLLRFIFQTVGKADIDAISSEEIMNCNISVKMQEIQTFAKNSTMSEGQKVVDFFKGFKEDVKNDVSACGYIDDSFKPAKKIFNFAFLPIFATVFVNIFCFFMTSTPFLISIILVAIPIVLAIAYQAVLSKIKRRTQSGEEKYHEWALYKKYLLKSAKLKDAELKNPETWESNLVYAVSFDIAKKITNELFIDVNSSQYPSNNYYYSNDGYMWNSHVWMYAYAYGRCSIMPTSSSSSSGGGFGGGGGFSSGGGGGGGFSSR